MPRRKPGRRTGETGLKEEGDDEAVHDVEDDENESDDDVDDDDARAGELCCREKRRQEARAGLDQPMAQATKGRGEVLHKKERAP